MSTPTTPARNVGLMVGGIVVILLSASSIFTGLGLIVWYYLSGGLYPIPNAGLGNLFVGLTPFLLGVVFVVVGSIMIRRSSSKRG